MDNNCKRCGEKHYNGYEALCEKCEERLDLLKDDLKYIKREEQSNNHGNIF